MNVHELTRDQLVELKQAYLAKLDDEGTLNEVLYNDPDDDSGLSWGELANADSLVPDEVIFNEYEGYDFSPDDFSIDNPGVLTIECGNIEWDIDDVDCEENFGSTRDDNGLPYTAKDFGLPSSVILQMSKAKYEDMVEGGEDDDESMDDYICDRLANEYDFCVKSFIWHFINPVNPTTKEDNTMKTKTTAKKQKIPFAEWLRKDEGKSFLETCDTFRYETDKVTEAVINCFGSDGWIPEWIGENDENFPFVDPDLTADEAFAILYGVITKYAEDAPILLTYGPNYSDDRENYAYDCLKEIAGDHYAPQLH